MTTTATTTAQFWDHSKQHGSKTMTTTATTTAQFWDHSKQHGSKTHWNDSAR